MIRSQTLQVVQCWSRTIMCRCAPSLLNTREASHLHIKKKSFDSRDRDGRYKSYSRNWDNKSTRDSRERGSWDDGPNRRKFDARSRGDYSDESYPSSRNLEYSPTRDRFDGGNLNNGYNREMYEGRGSRGNSSDRSSRGNRDWGDSSTRDTYQNRKWDNNSDRFDSNTNRGDTSYRNRHGSRAKSRGNERDYDTSSWVNSFDIGRDKENRTSQRGFGHGDQENYSDENSWDASSAQSLLKPMQNRSVKKALKSDPSYSKWHDRWQEKREDEEKFSNEDENYIRLPKQGHYEYRPEAEKYRRNQEKAASYHVKKAFTHPPAGLPLQSHGISDAEHDERKARYLAGAAAKLDGEENHKVAGVRTLERETRNRGVAWDDDDEDEDYLPKGFEEKYEVYANEYDRFIVTDSDELNRVNESSELIDFSELGVREDFVELLEKNNIAKPTAVQALAIPKLLENKSVIMESVTGSGKTLAYLLPLLQDINPAHKCSHMIITPSRELATQVYTEVLKYGFPEEQVARFVSGTGEADERPVEEVLKSSSLLIGTPKRLLQIADDHLDYFKQVKMVVLDEVDKLYRNQNWYRRSQIVFRPDRRVMCEYGGKAGQVVPTRINVKQKISHTKPTELLVSLLQYQKRGRRNVQLVGTSATVDDYFTNDLLDWCFPKETSLVHLVPKTHRYGMIPPNIELQHLVMPKLETSETIAKLFKSSKETSVLLVIGKELSVERVVQDLRNQGLAAEVLYKFMGLNDTQVDPDFYNRFESGEIQIAVSSEQEARGLDFPFLKSMYITASPYISTSWAVKRKTFDGIAHFVHMAGRVGRKGQPARVVTFIPEDKDELEGYRSMVKALTFRNSEGSTRITASNRPSTLTLPFKVKPPKSARTYRITRGRNTRKTQSGEIDSVEPLLVDSSDQTLAYESETVLDIESKN